MASEVPKKMIKIQGSFTVSLQTRFGLGGIISNAAICFPSHRSLFIRCRFRAECPLEVNVLHSWAVVLSKFSGKSSLYE